MMHKLFLLVILFCFCIIAKANTNQTNLVVCAKDGARVAYTLREKPKITFTEADLVIKIKGVELYYSLENMDRLTYESNEDTSVRDMQTEKVSCKLDGDFLLFPALAAKSTVSIHSLNGALVFSKTIRVAGEYSFPVSSIESGVYVVTVNGITYKIVKR